MQKNKTSRRVAVDWTGASEPIAGIKQNEQKAKNAGVTATDTGAGYGTSAAGVGSALVPEEEKQLNTPTGIAPTDLQTMETKGAEAIGGANSGIVGEATNRATRTNNTGALSGVLDEAARQKGKALSTNAQDIQGLNAQVKLKQQSQAADVLKDVYGTDVGAQLKAEGLVPEDINAWANAQKNDALNEGVSALSSSFGKAAGGGIGAQIFG